MMLGSEPVEAKPLILARAFKPYLSPISLFPSSIPAAPSTIPDELPAV